MIKRAATMLAIMGMGAGASRWRRYLPLYSGPYISEAKRPIPLPPQKASEIMSILKLLGKHTFDVDTTKILASAFDTAWLSLQTSGSSFATDDRAAGTRDLLAKRIIEIAQRGERNRRRLVDDALAQFVNSN